MGGKADAPDNPYSERAAIIADRLYDQTNPLRGEVINTIAGDLARYQNPDQVYTTPAYGAIKAYNDRAYRQAKDNILRTTPAGGALFDKLGDLDISRAQDMTTSLGNLWQQQRELALQRGSTAAFGTPGTTLSGLTGAAATESQAQAAAMQSNAAMGQGIGQMIGGLGKAYLLS